MIKLIEELKAEHTVIIDMFSGLKSLDVMTKEGQIKLLEVKTVFFAHIRKEETKLYPVAKNAAKGDEAFKRKLARIEREEAETSRCALDFFEKYSDGGSKTEFAKESARLYRMIVHRIRNEESTLFKVYKKQHHKPYLRSGVLKSLLVSFTSAFVK
ncbi:MAG: hemerythrin domain-containing protein [Gammaproteobacteria bacterium]|nr:hemerythrin domain-containing protein [Gammaproteobacteria bacterium]